LRLSRCDSARFTVRKAAAMAQRMPKTPIPVDAGQPIVLGDQEWADVENAYGHSLPAHLRELIQLATEMLQRVGAAERRAPTIDRMSSKTISLAKAARALLHEVDYAANENADTVALEDQIKNLAAAMEEFPSENVQFPMIVWSLLQSCNRMLASWKSKEGLLQEGLAWAKWVQAITEMMREHGLPTEVRKDSDKRDADRVNSPFVRLIYQLQNCIPENLRRHAHSKDGLSQAIHRVRKLDLRNRLLTPETRTRFAEFLESTDERRRHIAAFEEGLRHAGWVERKPGDFRNADKSSARLPRTRSVDSKG
jgi:hypothetical protein